MIDSWAHDAAATALVRFHPPATGLWRGANAYSPTDPGSLTCPDAAVVAHPTPNGAWGGLSSDLTGRCDLVQVPSPPGDQRTAPQIAADNAAHLSVRLYGLVAGAARTLYKKSIDNIDGSGGVGILYIDPAQVRWHIQVATVQATGGCSATIKVRRWGHFEPGRSFGVLTKTLSAAAGYLPNNGPLTLLAHKPDGSEIYFGSMRYPTVGNANPWGLTTLEQQSWPTCFWRLAISGTGNEGAADFGLAFIWEIDIPQQEHSTGHVYRRSGGAYVPGTPYWTGDAPQNNGFWTYPYSKTTVPPQNNVNGYVPIPNCIFGWRDDDELTESQDVYTYRLWPTYTDAGALVWLTLRHEVYSLDHRTQTCTVSGGTSAVVAGSPQPYVLDGPHSLSGTLDQEQWQRWTLSIGSQTLLDETAVALDVHTTSSDSQSDYTYNLHNLGAGSTSKTYVADENTPLHTASPSNYNTMSYRWDMQSGASQYPGGGARIDPMQALSVVRYSPALFGAFRRAYSLNFPGGTESGVACSLVNAGACQGAVASFSEACVNGGPNPTYFSYVLGVPTTVGKFGTYHPVTHALAWDTVPICWV